MNETSSMKEQLDIAKKAATVGAQAIMQYWNNNVEIHSKSTDRDLVTAADNAADAAIQKILTDAYPEYGIISEESPEANADAEYVWTIDPMDGTVNFTMGQPLFGVMISLLHNMEPVLGVVYLPALDEMYWAVKNEGAWVTRGDAEPVRCQVSSVDTLEHTRLNVGPSYRQEGYDRLANALPNMMQQVQTLRLLFCAAYECALIARGGLDASIGYRTSTIWDLAPLMAIIEEAGGTVTDNQGKRVDFTAPQQQDVICSNSRITKQLEQFFKA